MNYLDENPSDQAAFSNLITSVSETHISEAVDLGQKRQEQFT